MLLAGHFGNWGGLDRRGDVGIQSITGYSTSFGDRSSRSGSNDLVMRRFQKAGFGTLDKSGSLDEILDLERNHIVVSIFDQFTIQKYGSLRSFSAIPLTPSKVSPVRAVHRGASDPLFQLA